MRKIRFLFALAVGASCGTARSEAPAPAWLAPADARMRPGERVRTARSVESFRGALASGMRPAAPEPSVCPPRTHVTFGSLPIPEQFSQLQQSVAPLAGGGFGVVWDEGAYPLRTVRIQMLDAAGHEVLPPGGIVVSGTGSSDSANAVIVADPGAGAFIGYTRANGLVVQRFDEHGVAQWSGAGASATDGSHGWVQDPNLVPDGQGGVFVCFETSDAGPLLDVRCEHLDAAGARAWQGPGVSVGSGGSDEWRFLPRGVSDGAGGLLVFWRNQRSTTAPAGPMLMEGQRFSAAGEKLWGPSPRVVRTTGLAASNAGTFSFFQVVADGSGGAVLAFDDYTGLADLDLDVVAQRVAGDGTLYWGSGAVVTAATGHQQHEQTIATGDGGAFVAIFEEIGANRSRLWLHRLGPLGQRVWPASGLLLSDPGATALDYAVFGSFDDGALRLGFTHQLFPGTFEMDVQLAVVAPEGQRIGSGWLSQAPDAQFLRGLAFSRPFGGILGVWDDRSKGTWSDTDVKGATTTDLVSCPGGFHTLAPCRLSDTRTPGLFPLTSGQTSTFLAAGACGVPASATAIAANLTAVSPVANGYLTVFPAGQPPPLASCVSLRAGRTQANNAVVRLAFDGAFSVLPVMPEGGTVDLVVDVSGYFQ